VEPRSQAHYFQVSQVVSGLLMSSELPSRAEIAERLAAAGYIADPQLAMALLLMRKLERPLLLEGDPGVGKTAVAAALARLWDTELIRLQCYEGLDTATAVYEWNYRRQLLAIQLRAEEGVSAEERERHLFSREYLLERPLLQAITRPRAPVLLIDEIDRADEEFEAFLLELLSEYQVSIPEIGTVKATSIPMVVLTSNGTRELGDALRRRCLYHYVDYPGEDKELRIILAHQPHIEIELAQQIARFVHAIRREELRKRPGLAETLDWAAALVGLGIKDLRDEPELLYETLLCLLKTQQDRGRVAPVLAERLAAAAAGGRDHAAAHG
jgi:MoxR-like ATPase